MLTLWDLIDPLLSKLIPQGSAKPAAPSDKGRMPSPVSSASGVNARVGVLDAPQKRAGNRVTNGSRGPGGEVRPTPTKRRAKQAEPEQGMQAKYDAVVKLMLTTYGIRVRKWRKNMSGIAWYVTYRDGSVQRLIESPKPKGPMSAAIFLHEIGHHAIGFDVYKPRCLEEFHAWRWSLEAMEAQGLNITDQVRLRMHRSLHYAVQKAKRRGIRQIPDELTPFLEKPPASARRRR